MFAANPSDYYFNILVRKSKGFRLRPFLLDQYCQVVHNKFQISHKNTNPPSVRPRAFTCQSASCASQDGVKKDDTNGYTERAKEDDSIKNIISKYSHYTI